MPHRLDPLLRPRSIAVIGATERAGTVGRAIVENLRRGGFDGELYAINPRYQSVCGVPCYASLADLRRPVEHVIFAVSDERIEAALDQAIAHGARAVTLFSSLVLAADTEPTLRARVLAKIRAADLVVCGANGMGFYNFSAGIWACGFHTRAHLRGGNVAYISHSGSGMCGLVDTEERIDFNLVVSTGQELAVSMDEYLDFALDMPGTRVVGLFMETARNPQGLINAFEKAQHRGIPIVALKVGRTELSAKLTVSHTGAIAGEDGVYQALFDRYGVQRVADLEQLRSALIMFAQPHPVAAGGLVSIHDSGGERQLLIDLAADAGVPLTTLTPASTHKLQTLLDPGLPPVNPLDAWSTGGPDYHVGMQQCFSALLDDPGAALGAVVHDRVAGGLIHASYLDYLRAGNAVTGKPVFLVSNSQGTGADPQVVTATRAGFPVLDGIPAFLRGVRCLLDYRDHQADYLARARAASDNSSAAAAAAVPSRMPTRVPAIAPSMLAACRARLAQQSTFDENAALTLLRDCGLPANAGHVVETEGQALSAARALGFPVAMKTAMPGIDHKSDRGGVRLDIGDELALAAAWRDLAQKLGPRVLVVPMIRARGVELLLGMVRDAQFGPVVVLGFGGVHVEALADVAYALPPFDAAHARRLLDGLKGASLLRSHRHPQPLALGEFCRAAAHFSLLAPALGERFSEVDLNPVIVHADGISIVDALMVTENQPRPT